MGVQPMWYKCMLSMGAGGKIVLQPIFWAEAQSLLLVLWD